MSNDEWSRALSALAQPTRLSIVRLLGDAGEVGVTAGVIADEVGIPRNLASSHLAVLSAAELVGSRRSGRNVTYVLRGDTVEACATFLRELRRNDRADPPTSRAIGP